MSVPYSPRLIELALQIAHEKGIKLHTGVYCGVEGPNLETPAEYSYLRTIGGDAVGMSTVPEVLVACHAGMEVFGLLKSLSNNKWSTISALSTNEIFGIKTEVSPNTIRVNNNGRLVNFFMAQ